MRSIKNSRNKKCVTFLICTILLFSQSENNKILELIKPEVLLIVQFENQRFSNSRI